MGRPGHRPGSTSSTPRAPATRPVAWRRTAGSAA